MQDKLISVARENKTILCFGIDPDIGRLAKAMPNANLNSNANVKDAINTFFNEIIDRLLTENAIAALKPNYAYFAQYGFEGLYALRDLIGRYRNKTLIIFDGKRGDIGKSSEAYACEVFDFWGADAITISPYMGSDSVAPFLRGGKLAYMLCRTSNKGAEDFQHLKCGRQPLYEKVAAKALEWKCGLVVGATSDSIKKIAKQTKGQVPFLIPGVGSQGGDLEMVMKAIESKPLIHRINASSSIAYAFEKSPGTKPADAAIKEAETLNTTIRKYI